jgi:hypothetical protein
MEVILGAEADLDLAFKRIEALAEARGLKDVSRGTDDGSPALKVMGRIFVEQLDVNTIVLQCPLEQKVLLMEISPDTYFETDDYVGREVVLVRLGSIDDEELALRLEDAWRFRSDATSTSKEPRA